MSEVVAGGATSREFAGDPCRAAPLQVSTCLAIISPTLPAEGRLSLEWAMEAGLVNISPQVAKLCM